ncbi:MAG: right-handed parallel beta-helix repeat-containing protein [Terracidiphilus sp.]
MKSLRFVLSLVVISVIAASASQGQANRTWVSHTGNDSNSCTATSPCMTFAGAYAKTAAGGEIDALDAGDFGPVSITHAITIDGGSNQLATIFLGTSNLTGVTVNVGSSSTVTLRNLSIHGTGLYLGQYGIIGASAQTLHIEHCAVSNVESGVMIENSSTLVNVFIDDTVVRDSAYGFLLNGTSNVSISGSRLLNNSYGVLTFGSNMNASISNSDVSGNLYGFYVVGSSNVFVANSTVTNNQDYGLFACGLTTVTLSNDSFYNNPDAAVADCGATVLDTFKNNSITGLMSSTTAIPLQ